jgi:hypothetical protein
VITDDQSLKSVTNSYGRSLPVWDDGFGPLWIYRDSTGVVGIVRAESWEKAYECVVDEIMPDADPTDPDNAPDAQGNLPEGVHYRGCTPSNSHLKSHLAQSDLNGESLDPLTETLAKELELIVELS